jgi:hypothetical protein
MSPLHWCTCANSFLLDTIISNAITNCVNSANLDFSNNKTKELIQKIKDHSAFKETPLHSSSHYLEITLKGLIPLSLIKTIQDLEVPYKLASTITINILLEINKQIYEQLWKPYCVNFSNWKKQQQITNTHTTQQSSSSYSRKNIHTRHNFTYSCVCGQPDQLHSHTGTCPLVGRAFRKISTWATLWVKYHTTSNFILTINDII